MADNQSIPIESLKRMRLREGDTVIIKCPYRMTMAEKEAIQREVDRWKSLIKVDFHSVILDSGLDIEVINIPVVYGGD